MSAELSHEEVNFPVIVTRSRSLQELGSSTQGSFFELCPRPWVPKVSSGKQPRDANQMSRADVYQNSVVPHLRTEMSLLVVALRGVMKSVDQHFTSDFTTLLAEST